MTFKQIPEFPNYSINELGQVYSKHSNKILATYLNGKGYLCVKLHINGIQKTMSIHRLLARVFLDLPSLDSELEVDHKNTDKSDNKLSNLQVLDFKAHRNKTILENNQKIREAKFCIVCNSMVDSSNKSGFCRDHLPRPSDNISIEQLEYWVVNFSWTRAAKELGISDTGLRKFYRRKTGKDPKSLKK
jgi:hypothetical protein